MNPPTIRMERVGPNQIPLRWNNTDQDPPPLPSILKPACPLDLALPQAHPLARLSLSTPVSRPVANPTVAPLARLPPAQPPARSVAPPVPPPIARLIRLPPAQPPAHPVTFQRAQPLTRLPPAQTPTRPFSLQLAPPASRPSGAPAQLGFSHVPHAQFHKQPKRGAQLEPGDPPKRRCRNSDFFLKFDLPKPRSESEKNSQRKAFEEAELSLKKCERVGTPGYIRTKEWQRRKSSSS